MTNITFTLTDNSKTIHLTGVVYAIQGMTTSWTGQEEVKSGLNEFVKTDGNKVESFLTKMLIDVIGEDFIKEERAKDVVRKIRERIGKGLTKFKVGPHFQVKVEQ